MAEYEPILLANIHKTDSHTLPVYEAAGGYSGPFARHRRGGVTGAIGHEYRERALRSSLAASWIRSGGSSRSGPATPRR